MALGCALFDFDLPDITSIDALLSWLWRGRGELRGRRGNGAPAEEPRLQTWRQATAALSRAAVDKLGMMNLPWSAEVWS